MPVVQVSRDIAGRLMTLETGRIAKQADGAVMIRYGDTMVLATAVSADPRPGIDFFPLTVDYREMMSAAGKIPGGFFKREGRPTTKETLTARSIDRPIRPLFPANYKDDVAITVGVYSADRVNDPDVLGMNAASAALAISTIPFEHLVGSVRVGRLDGKWVINPTIQQMEESELDLLLSGTREKLVMIEVEAREIPEEQMLDAIRTGHKAILQIIELQEELREKAGKPKEEVPPPPADAAGMVREIHERFGAEIAKVFQVKGKLERKRHLSGVLQKAREHLQAKAGEAPLNENQLKTAYDEVYASIFRETTLKQKTRVDGRRFDELRAISCEVGYLPCAHGSAIFTRGETQALVTTTLGTSFDEQRMEGLNEEVFRTFMLHYNFPAYSVGETWPNRGPKRREIGHGDLAERSLKAVLPSHDEFPYTIRIVSDIQESNGSTSMASTCGGTLSLMDAGVPIRSMVAGISIGLLQEGGQHALLTDIQGDEDHHGDMDFKVCGTEKGITGIQVDLKIDGLTIPQIEGAFKQARAARMEILRVMRATIARPKETLSPHAPKLRKLKIPQDKIGMLIGPGGRTIRELQQSTGSTVEVEDDGTVTLSSRDGTAVDRAYDFIHGMMAGPEIGRVYKGRVTGIKDFGAFVEYIPGHEGLVHISEFSKEFVKDIHKHVKMGDILDVKVIAVDEQGRTKLSRKAALAEMTEGGEKKEEAGNGR